MPAGAEPRWVPKELGDSIGELLQSLQVIRDSVGGMAIGGTHQVIPLSGQLRALLVEKSKRAHSLLIHVTRQLGLSPTVFLMDGVDVALPAGMPKPIFHLAGFPYSSKRELPGQHEIALSDLPDQKLIEFEGSLFSVKDVIKFFADYSGGAHYSKALPDSFARMIDLTGPRIGSKGDALINSLRQMGAVTYQVGLDVVRAATDLDILLDMAVVQPVPGDLMDAGYPDSPLRLSLKLADDLHLVAMMIGIDGAPLGLRVPELVDWAVPHLVHISVRQTDALATSLKLDIDDGMITSEALSASPVFLPSVWRDYNVSINSGLDQKPNGSSLALTQLAVFGHSTPGTVAQALGRFIEDGRDPERKTVLYKAGGMGRAPSGEGDLQKTGPVVMARMSTVYDTGGHP